MKRPSLEHCTALLQSMVAIDTSQPQGNESILVAYIMDLFKNYPVKMRRIEHTNTRSSLLIQLPSEQNTGGLALFAHLDTVAFGNIDSWRYPPLSCTIENGAAYGRGTADMKGGATAMIEAACCLLDNGVRLKKPVILCFTADEESGGMGIVSMAKDPWLKMIDSALICEPTGGRIGIAEKGALWLRLDVTGVQAHGSRPEVAVNALDYAIAFVDRFKSKIDTTTQNPLLGNTTVSLTRLEGGIMTNVIPGNATLEMDIRTLPTDSHKEIIDLAQSLCDEIEASQQNSSLSLKLTCINNRPPVETALTDSFINRLQTVCRENGLNDATRGLLFYTDASQLIPALSLPFAILGPGDDKQAHQTDEHIALSSIIQMAELYFDYIIKYL